MTQQPIRDRRFKTRVFEYFQPVTVEDRTACYQPLAAPAKEAGFINHRGSPNVFYLPSVAQIYRKTYVKPFGDASFVYWHRFSAGGNAQQCSPEHHLRGTRSLAP